MISTSFLYGNPTSALHRNLRGRIARTFHVLLISAAIAWIPWRTGAALGQLEPRKVPSLSYHAGLALLAEGEYRDALEHFKDAWKGAFKTPRSRWIDSICYHAMLGECYYQMGDLNSALEHYTSAVRLYLAFPDWMRRVQFPSTIQPAQAAATRATPWGVSTRPARLGRYPSEMLIGQGRLDNNSVIKQGGVIQLPQLLPIQVQEVVRATVLAIRRRGELLGPLAKYDPLNQELITVLSQGPGLPNHWSQAWVDAQLGVALLYGGKQTEAVATLNRSLVAAGEFDHPLTASSLLELGKAAFFGGNQAEAARLFLEASFSAYHYADLIVLDEALRYGALVHLVSNAKGVYPPLASVAQWARTKNFRQVRVTALLAAAEQLAAARETAQAVAMLDDAATTIGRRTLGQGRHGAWLSYLRGLTLFQQRKMAAGDAAIREALAYMQHGSLWLFRIAQADGRLLADQITPRTAMELYRELLRDPQAGDWAWDPLESLSVLVIPHGAVYERWFLVALKRNDHESALEIADRARRHRFFSALAFGGRLQALRWVLEAPEEALDAQALLERQNLLASYPGYQRLSEMARRLRSQVRKLPAVPADADRQRELSGALGELGNLSQQQEAILREMALSRQAASLAFPPVRPTREVQKAIPKGTAVLLFFSAGNDLYAFLLTQDKYGHWTVKAAPLVSRKVVSLLRELGNYEQNHELGLVEITSTQWKQTARQLLDALLAGSPADFTRRFPELVVVPDGILWYLPFEALQVQAEGQLHPLIARFRIRYAPTLSLVVPDRRGRNPASETAVVIGKLYPRDEPTVAQAAYEQLAKSLPGTWALSKPPLPAPSSWYKVRMDRLIVLDDLPPADAPLAWSPIPIDRNKPGNTLDDWLALPWGGPEVVILPGFHTPAENSLRRAGRSEPGAEVFMSVCALLSSGAKTLLLSRWRTGGQSSFDLVREFAQELPHTAPAEAWQRAVLLARQSRVNPDAEPRIRLPSGASPPLADHPFFWAGYLLVDDGTPAQKSEPAEKPAGPENPKGPIPGNPGAKRLPEKPDNPEKREAPGTPKPAEADHPAEPGPAALPAGVKHGKAGAAPGATRRTKGSQSSRARNGRSGAPPTQ